MERNTIVLIGVIAVMLIGVIAYRGGITGSAVTGFCSNLPEITYLEEIGDRISVNWKDTSTDNGVIKYEAKIYQRGADGSYDMSNSLRKSAEKMPYTTFTNILPGTYLVQVRAKNQRNCPIEWSEWVSKEIIKTP